MPVLHEHLRLRAAWIIAAILVFGAGGRAGAQQAGSAVANDPAPVVNAFELGTSVRPVFRPSAHPPAAAPNHPPIALIPPMPMPMPAPANRAATSAISGRGQGVMYDPASRRQFVSPMAVKADAGDGTAFASGGGYKGSDGGTFGASDEVFGASMSTGSMTLVPTANRSADPYRMNVKVVLRFGSSYFVCSGTMRDAATVLTAGHCVYDIDADAWADEIWVYPAWDGSGSVVPTPSIVNPFGWAHSTILASWTGWTTSHDFNFDIGIVALDRAVGMLTGWYGWSYGGTCAFWQSTLVSNLSYPAESCGITGLHNGRDMYFWSGSFDSCPNTNRLGLNTLPGCFRSVWGGMSGSGVYYTDPSNNRLVHAVTSTSNRSSYAEYQRQFEDWVNFNNTEFIPTSARGPNFDLQPLSLRGPTTVTAGDTIAGLTHVAANGSNGSANSSYTFRVYLSSNDQVAASDTLLSTQTYNLTFGPVSSAVIAMPGVTIPSNTPPGAYYLGVIYDDATDGNPGNNDTKGWDALPITVVSSATDLTASSLSAQANASPGSSFNVSNGVTNTGASATGSFRVGLYLSDDSVCSVTDTLIGNRTIASLAAGATSTASTIVVIPPGTPLGPKFLCAIADDQDAVGESNEGNNTRSAAIGILSPTPVITMKINGQHPVPAVVSTSGPVTLTVDVSPTTYTAAVDWYWVVAVNNTLYWMTSTGVSTVPAPLRHSAPVVIANATLLNVTLPAGTTFTSAMFMVNGSVVVSSDMISAQAPALAALPPR